MPRHPRDILRDFAAHIRALDAAQKADGAGAPSRTELQDFVTRLVAHDIEVPAVLRNIADYPCPTAGSDACLPDVTDGSASVKLRHTRRTVLREWQKHVAARNSQALAAIDALSASLPADDRQSRRKRRIEPLSPREQQVYDIIAALPEGEGRTGKELQKMTSIDQSTITSHIIPRLKKRPFNVRNRRGVGYYRAAE